jgi:plastocyanin
VTWLSRYFGIHALVENQELYSSKDWRPDNSFEFTIYLRGTYEYHCKLHPLMTGKVNLR